MEQRATAEAIRAELSFADLVARIGQFSGPPGEFLTALLATQCRVAAAEGGAILAVSAPPASTEGNGESAEARPQVRVLVVHPMPPADQPAPLWLAQSVEAAPRALQADTTTTLAVRRTGLERGEPDAHLVSIPLRAEAGRRALAVYCVATGDEASLARARERLELTIGLLTLYELRMSAQARQADLQRLRTAMEVLDAVNEQSRMKAAAMALCNEIASRWNAERVSLGFHEGRYVKTVAMSHTERFDRKMRLVQDIESAMEECLDQDVEIIHPPPETSTFVARAAGDLSTRHGPACILCVPLRDEGETTAVLVVERPPDEPLALDEIETLRLTADLCTARLVDLHTHDKWLGARAVDLARDGLGKLVGPRHTWAKVIAVGILLLILFLVLVKGPDRVDADFTIQAIERRIVPAPYAARIESVHVRPGDPVVSGETVLATLETVELQLHLASARAERLQHLKEADLALRERRTVEVQIAEANLQRVEAEIRLLEHQIGEARLVAPVTGTVLVGDLEREIGAPVETGDVLFEIAPLGALRAELEVPEDRIADLITLDERDGDAPEHGTLATISHPGDYIPFQVERIDPVAEVVNQQNVFKVRVRLLQTRPWLRPGMEGVAKVDVGRRPYGYLWTRKLVNWVRMKLWI